MSHLVVLVRLNVRKRKLTQLHSETLKVRGKDIERLMGVSRLEQEAMRSKQKKGYGYASKAVLGEKHSCSPGRNVSR